MVYKTQGHQAVLKANCGELEDKISYVKLYRGSVSPPSVYVHALIILLKDGYTWSRYGVALLKQFILKNRMILAHIHSFRRRGILADTYKILKKD